MSRWKKLSPLPGKPNPCLNCPPITAKLGMSARIAVGFGEASLCRDGELVWGEEAQDWEDCLSVKQAERMAAKDPNHDWRIVLCGPLHGETYQRQGKGSWVLVEKNEGFA